MFSKTFDYKNKLSQMDHELQVIRLNWSQVQKERKMYTVTTENDTLKQEVSRLKSQNDILREKLKNLTSAVNNAQFGAYDIPNEYIIVLSDEVV